MSSDSKPSTKFGMSSCGWIDVDGFVLACKYESPENIQRCIYDSHRVSWQEAAFKNCAVYNYEMVKRLKAELEAERATVSLLRERLSKYEPVGDDYDEEEEEEHIAIQFKGFSTDDVGNDVWEFEELGYFSLADKDVLEKKGRQDIIKFIEEHEKFSEWHEKCPGCLSSVENCQKECAECVGT